jgi:ATP-dependent Clp protease adaptor protein ClpS
MAVENEFEIQDDLELDFIKKYKVYLLNDDYTPMDFVVDILMKIFYKSYEDAERIMLEIHNKDMGLCGIYSYEIAETKITQVHQKARQNGYPLKAYMEEE